MILFSRSKSYPFLCLALFLTLLSLGCAGSSHKKYTIALDPQWFTLDIPGKETNLVGLCTELLQEITQEEGIDFAILSSNNADLIGSLRTEKAEGIFSAMQPYSFLSETYDFSDPILLTGPALVVPVSSPAHSIDQLSGREVAIIAGSKNALILEKNPQIIIREYMSISNALNDLAAGNVDAALLNNIVAHSYCEDLYHGQLKVATKPLSEEGVRLIVLHGKNPVLLEKFQKGLHILQKNEKYAKLLAKWGFPKGD